jgi:type III pantothenate kinase
MKLLIDIGNSRVKLGVLTPDNERHFLAALDASLKAEPHLVKALVDELAKLPQMPEATWAVSVSRPSLQDKVQSVLRHPITWIKSTAQAAGVINQYPDPQQLGADRWVAVIGLTRHFPAPKASLVLANFGTATTVDTLGIENVFRGGLILPGVTLMRDALAQATARLPNTPGEITNHPENTANAIASGIAAAQVGAIRRQIDIVQEQDGVCPILCVSGGAYHAMQAEISRALPHLSVHVLPHIVLDGLAVLATQDQVKHPNPLQ